MDTCNRLTDIANEARAKLAALNAYQNVAGKIYGASHPNATQDQGGNDDPLNVKGKGTQSQFDTENGGGFYDINGRPDVTNSGRIAHYSNLYNKNNNYNCIIETNTII